MYELLLSSGVEVYVSPMPCCNAATDGHRFGLMRIDEPTHRLRRAGRRRRGVMVRDALDTFGSHPTAWIALLFLIVLGYFAWRWINDDGDKW